MSIIVAHKNVLVRHNLPIQRDAFRHGSSRDFNLNAGCLDFLLLRLERDRVQLETVAVGYGVKLNAVYGLSLLTCNV
jgi:hypothetical protein